ncbi:MULTISPECIES: arginine-ornithine antiporter [Sinorhizobium]|uniref:Arginine-ornithine antiporter n=1 Tax=Rhizobium fredii TaxID=380 RepID=A0A2L0HGQ9_RHIFR|nr:MULTISPECIES: arginine-ornithine antiporter [Sinorhizobium]AUX80653.1 arginine/ornithine antiporter [Sinorhizobium fredii]PDT51359.1 arginine-ornithine antiporter [Sinorhizobium sp. NG07B]POH26010.1 arginine-ornithine antiporter [Sinorhizobium americanum]
MTIAQEGTFKSEAHSDKLTLLPLTALVVGSMIGGGVFNLPSDMSRAAAPGAILIGWIITGFGMLMLAFVYQTLANRKPDLNAGPYAYAKAGFGPFVGFISAWGYWLSAFLGNVAYAVAIFSGLSFFIPVFEDGNNLVSIVGASFCLWAIHWLVLKGVKQAAFVNIVTTIAKLAPLFLFVLIAIVAFNWDRFTLDFWGRGGALDAPDLGSVMAQVKSTMLVTLWVFIGIEGASVYSARAARRSDVGRATVIGFIGALGIYVLVSLLSTGILSQPELAGLKVPSMAGVLQPLVGQWGAALINAGLIVSVGGAFLSWTLLCSEIPYTCGRDGTFPRWFAADNENGSPVNSLWATNILIQLFLVLSFFSKSAYQFFYFIASVAILPPYVFSGAYALKLALSGETYQQAASGRSKDIAIGALATLYGIWLVYAAGLSYLLMCSILFAPGLLVYARARQERGERAFAGFEIWLAGLVVLLAILAAYLLWIGKISPL